VAFASSSGALTGLGDGERTDVFVHDRQTGATTLVSVAAAGGPVPAGVVSSRPALSADGRVVSFITNAALAPEDSDFFEAVYLRDRTAGTTELVSVGLDGAAAMVYPLADAPLSADGHFVAFISGAPLVVGDEPADDVFIRDRAPAATTFTVSGAVVGPDGGPLAGVVVSDSQGRTATSGSDGAFAFDGQASGTYLLTPQLAGYGFTPASDYVTTPPNGVSVTFVAREAYDIAGRIVYPDGSGLSNVAVALSDGQTAYTDSDGYYRFEDVTPGDYTLTPSHELYDFTPSQRELTLGPDATGQDFAAQPKLSSISGAIRDEAGEPLPGVRVDLSGYDISTVTDENGFYQFTGVPVYQVAVRPSLAGYRFEPEYQVVLYVPGDATDVDFVGISLGLETVYVSPTRAGKVGGVAFNANDILAYDLDGRTWSLYFDGSDVGLRGNVNNFTILEDGSILLTLEQSQHVPGVGTATANDMLSFTPSSLGPDTAGTLALYFDGSDVGLSTPAERLDALSDNGADLLLSTRGQAQVASSGQRVVARDDDILLFYPWSLGAQTAGHWQLYRWLVTLPDMRTENVVGLSYDPLLGDLYVSFATQFNIDGVKGRPGTILRLVDDPFGGYTPAAFWDATTAGLAAPIDGVEVGR
jgi:hypothetical protein